MRLGRNGLAAGAVLLSVLMSAGAIGSECDESVRPGATDVLSVDDPGTITLSSGEAEFIPMPEVTAEVARNINSAYESPSASKNTGWRMGAVYVAGGRKDDLAEELGMGNIVSAWGYQFEWQKGIPGTTVGLVDVVPMLLGLDESMLIPTVNVLVGLRMPNNLEFGLGPHFSPRAPALAQYFDDDVHIEGMGLCAALGYSYATDGGVNMSVNLSAMWAGDLSAYGVTVGWNTPN